MGWTSHQTENGKLYYYNDETRETTWDKPEELLTEKERVLRELDWKEYVAEGGRTYWYNTVSGKSSWELPSEVADKLKSSAGSNASILIVNSTTDSTIGRYPETKGKEEYEFKHSNTFVEAMINAEVNSDSRWENKLEKLVDDLGYWSAGGKTAVDRKKNFDEYVRRMKEAEENNKLSERAQRLRNMQNILESKQWIGKLKPYSRYVTTVLHEAGLKKSLDEICSDEKEQRYAFDKVVEHIKKEQDQGEKQDRDRDLARLRRLFEELGVEVHTPWKEAEERIQDAIAVLPRTSQIKLDKLDVLITFEDYVRSLEKEVIQERQLRKDAEYREERKAREAFAQLIAEMRESGQITLTSKWADIYEQIKDQEAYLAMCGAAGSTPVELFWDAVVDEERRFKIQRELVVDILGTDRRQNSQLNTVADLVRIVKNDPRGESISDSNMEAIYESVLQMMQQDKHVLERRVRRAQDDLYDLLRSLDNPHIEPSNRWEDVEPRIRDTPEYEALADDKLRKQVFEWFIRRLAEKRRSRERRRYDVERQIRNNENLRNRADGHGKPGSGGPQLEY